MEIGFQSILINPNFATRVVGDFKVNQLISITKGDCFARCLFMKSDKSVLLITIDNWAIDEVLVEQIKSLVYKRLGSDVAVVISTASVFLTPSLSNGLGLLQIDRAYAKFLIDRIEILLIKLKTKPVQLSLTYHYHDTLELMPEMTNASLVRFGVVSFLDHDNYIGHWIIHNVTPGVNPPTANYFSSDVIGVVISLLQRKFPGEFFMSFLGAGSENTYKNMVESTTYEQSLRIASTISNQLIKIMENQSELSNVNLQVKQQSLMIHPTIKTAKDFQSLSLQSAQAASSYLPKMKTNQDKCPMIAEITTIKLGAIKVIFHPFSLFSWYQKSVPNDTILIGHSNGYAGVLTPINDLTMYPNSIFEIVSDQDKRTIFTQLQA